MATRFDHQAFEKKWQTQWEKDKLYEVGTRDSEKEKRFILTEFPYPSGNLHIGHWYAFAVPDIYVRKLRMEGKQVLYPVGFDSFGLPAENAAIKRKLDPKEWTYDNIAYMANQLKSMGNAFDWSRLVITSNPEYYRFTQWIFTECFKHDLAYRGIGTVNWCPSCNTVLANEQVVDGACERCGTTVELREMPEWKLRITKYADRLVDDLGSLPWPEFIKDLQRNWIGRSEGADIDFKLSTGDTLTVFTTRPDTLYGATFCVMAPEHALLQSIKEKIRNKSEVDAYVRATSQKDEIERTNDTKEKTGVKLEGVTATNPANGEQIPVFIADYILARYGTGAIMAVPAHDERDHAFAKKYNLPIKQVIAPYVIFDGVDSPRSEENVVRFDAATGIIKHWSEDKYYVVNFSQQLQGFVGGHIEPGETPLQAVRREVKEESGYTSFQSVDCILSHAFGRGYKTRKSREELCHDTVYFVQLADDSRTEIVDHETREWSWMTASEILSLKTFSPSHRLFFEHFIQNKPFTTDGVLVDSGDLNDLPSLRAKDKIIQIVGGRMKSTYRLRDWSIGRQRYWGVPIPVVYDPEGKPHAVPEEHLPWILPTDVDVTPTGEPPLAKSEELKKRTERIFGKGWTPEVETMDTFMCSSWYYLRYADPQNEDTFASKEAQEAWLPVDIYFGGSEHTTMHLLYSRFMQKVLLDLGYTSASEPYTMRYNRGLVLGPDGNKMSKSKGNVIDPDEQVARLGADTVKMYLAFMGPYGTPQNYPWDMGGIAGIRRFLERVYDLTEHLIESESKDMTRLLHQTILKVTNDIDAFKFNTAISALMVYLNAAEKQKISNESYTTFLQLLAPFAPHLAEELWHMHNASRGVHASIHSESWPHYDPALLIEDDVTLAVQINGKLRETLIVTTGASEEVVKAAAYAHPGVVARLEGMDVIKVINVPDRAINFVVKKQTSH